MRLKPIMVLTAACIVTTFAGASGQEKIDAAAIAQKGSGAAIPACESCHNGTALFPILAAQQERYIFSQLRDFRSGRRVNATMTPIAKALSEGQVAAMAKYFSEQPRKAAPAAAADPALIEKGKQLSVLGDSNRDIFACDFCHGAQGRGGDFAMLNGQNPAYVLAQVQNFRLDKRTNDELGIMQSIAKKLTDDDVKAVAAFYNQAALEKLIPPILKIKN